MRIREDSVTVRVPATSANLGPGFDCLGMALSHWDEVSVRAVAGRSRVTVHGYGAGVVDTGEENLVLRALRYALDEAGAPQVGVEMECRNRIPHGRGMGSSASAIVAGLALARGLIGDPECLTGEQMLALGTDMEGHPDNIAPAIFGGVTLSWLEDGQAQTVRLDPPALISPMLFIPDYEVSTHAARQALPAHIPFADAVYNGARVALLATVLSNGYVRTAAGHHVQSDLHGFLMSATMDRLHQEYRRSVMVPSMTLVDWLREHDYPAVISGAGPTVLSFEKIPADICAQARNSGWTVLNVGVSSTGVELLRGRLAGVSA